MVHIPIEPVFTKIELERLQSGYGQYIREMGVGYCLGCGRCKKTIHDVGMSWEHFVIGGLLLYSSHERSHGHHPRRHRENYRPTAV